MPAGRGAGGALCPRGLARPGLGPRATQSLPLSIPRAHGLRSTGAAGICRGAACLCVRHGGTSLQSAGDLLSMAQWWLAVGLLTPCVWSPSPQSQQAASGPTRGPDTAESVEHPLWPAWTRPARLRLCGFHIQVGSERPRSLSVRVRRLIRVTSQHPQGEQRPGRAVSRAFVVQPSPAPFAARCLRADRCCHCRCRRRPP